MKHRFLSMLVMLAMSVTAMAEEVPGVTVEYVDAGTASYVQAISTIGRIEFKEGNAVIVFKDEAAGTENGRMWLIAMVYKTVYTPSLREDVVDTNCLQDGVHTVSTEECKNNKKIT